MILSNDFAVSICKIVSLVFTDENHLFRSHEKVVWIKVKPQQTTEMILKDRIHIYILCLFNIVDNGLTEVVEIKLNVFISTILFVLL